MGVSWREWWGISFSWIKRGSVFQYLALLVLGVTTGCGASIHDKIAQGDMPGVQAMLERHPEWVKLQTNRGKTPLHYAVSYGQTGCMNVLLEHGADLNDRDHTGMTPLHVTAMLGRTREAEWLLDHGAQRDAKDSFGDTPLHTAAVFGQEDMVKMLLDRGSDGTARNARGKTPFELAINNRHPHVAELFGKPVNSVSGSTS
jgi:uncharacterized protein